MVESTEDEVDPGSADTEGFRRDVQRLTAYSYEVNVILAPTWVTRLQQAFTTLAELFDHVILHTNVSKTASIDC